MHWWGWHFIHWWTTDRATAIFTSVAALAAVVAVIVSGIISRRALSRAREDASQALVQARESSTKALAQASDTALADRRSQHQMLVYDRVVELRELSTSWYGALRSCHKAAFSLESNTSALRAMSRSQIQSGFTAAEDAVIQLDACLMSIQLLLSPADPDQRELDRLVGRLHEPIRVARNLMAGPPLPQMLTGRRRKEFAPL